MRTRVLPVLCAMFALAGCERGMHEMYEQPKYTPLKPSSLFANGNSSRPQAPGTQARSDGALAGASSGRNGKLEIASAPMPANADVRGTGVEPDNAIPLPITEQLLARGEQRFDIYCAPCHSRAGDGDGMIARRGFPRPPSFHTDALRNAPDSHFYFVISNGYGAMYPYSDRIAPNDRWAIVAYIRALQLSQHARPSELTVADLQKLGSARRSKPSSTGRAAGMRVRASGKQPSMARFSCPTVLGRALAGAECDSTHSASNLGSSSPAASRRHFPEGEGKGQGGER